MITSLGQQAKVPSRPHSRQTHLVGRRYPVVKPHRRMPDPAMVSFILVTVATSIRTWYHAGHPHARVCFMATSNSNTRREYMRTYQRDWLARRRSEWVQANGPCRQCGSGKDLEVDHIDPKTKTMATANIWSRRKEVREAELIKCQVLCGPCHQEKTSAHQKRPDIHGALHMYHKRKCRCRLCKDAIVEYWRDLRRRRKLAMRDSDPHPGA